MIIFIAVVLTMFLALPSSVFAQTCSCGGTPLLGSLELPATAAGNWQFALTYDYNNIADTYAGKTKLDPTLKRKTYSGLLEVSYGVSQRFSLSALVSFVQQDRKASNLTRTRGLGDVAILAKYSIVQMNAVNQRALAVGIGPKIPTGDTKMKNNGILLLESMQPGTGTWDLILWGYAFQGLQPRTATNIFATASYKISGKNWRNFRYGNEFSLTFGSSYVTTLPFDFSLLIRYRTIGEYSLNSNREPNTGGTWVNLLPGINVTLSNPLSFRVSGAIPLYTDVKGTQLTTTYSASISLFYTIDKKPELKIF